ncbi:MAG: cytochrome P450 [Cyanobacteria bacterium]|nr:cytochrome P450 [Cyanobacteriota bacterium]
MLMHISLPFALVPPVLAALVFLAPPFPGLFGRQALVPGLFFASWATLASVLLAAHPALHLPLALLGTSLALLIARGQLAAIVVNGPLPPGSLSFATGIRALARRDFYQRGFNRHGAIFASTQFGAPVICVSGLERICQLLRTHADQLGPSPLAFSQSVQGNFLRYMDNDSHSYYGGLFRRAMSGPQTAVVSSQLLEQAERTLGTLAASGWVSPAVALQRFSREALNLLLFEFTGRDPISHRFDQVSESFGRSSLGSIINGRERQQLDELTSLLDAQIQHLTSDAPSGQSVLLRLRELDSNLPDRVCLENLIFMQKIASNNVSSLLLWLLHNWGAYPEIAKQVQSISSGQSDEALDVFIAETLRLAQSEYIYRRVRNDFHFGGYIFPRGWMVRCCIWESHRSSQTIESPSGFKLRLDGGYDRSHYSPFGMDRHACNGVDLNHAICMAFLRCLATGYHVELRRSEPFQRQMRHWSHWVPNHSMTARLRPTQ